MHQLPGLVWTKPHTRRLQQHPQTGTTRRKDDVIIQTNPATARTKLHTHHADTDGHIKLRLPKASTTPTQHNHPDQPNPKTDRMVTIIVRISPALEATSSYVNNISWSIRPIHNFAITAVQPGNISKRNGAASLNQREIVVYTGGNHLSTHRLQRRCIILLGSK